MVTNEVLAAKLDVVIARQDKADAKFDSLGDTFVRKDIFDLRMRELDVQLKRLENRRTLMTWLIPTASAILGSVMTYLIIERLR